MTKIWAKSMKLLKCDKELISHIDLHLDSFHHILWVKYVLIVGTLKVCSIQFGGGFPSCLLEVWDTELDQTTENFSQEYRESWTPDPLLPMRTLKQIHSHSIWSVRDIYHWVQISVSLEGFRNWISTAWHWWSWTCVGSTWDFDVPPPAPPRTCFPRSPPPRVVVRLPSPLYLSTVFQRLQNQKYSFNR